MSTHKHDPPLPARHSNPDMTGGRERTEAEFRALFAAAGFELTRVLPAHPVVQVIEARAT